MTSSLVKGGVSKKFDLGKNYRLESRGIQPPNGKQKMARLISERDFQVADVFRYLFATRRVLWRDFFEFE